MRSGICPRTLLQPQDVPKKMQLPLSTSLELSMHSLMRGVFSIMSHNTYKASP